LIETQIDIWDLVIGHWSLGLGHWSLLCLAWTPVTAPSAICAFL
jgi:hypothetical protein